MKFGRLTLVEDMGMTVVPKKSTGRFHYVRCICDCGKEWIGRMSNLTGHKTISCGCALIEYRKQLPMELLRIKRAC